jgi:beta-phosphoglucomutase family hydrolase
MRSIAFVFDMDGVIIHSNPYHKIALHQFCEKYGYHLTEDQLRSKIYGRTNKQWITNLFERELGAEELHRFAEEKEGLFRDLIAKDIKALAGLKEFLDQMNAQKIDRAIGTSAPRSNVDFVMAKTQLTSYFSIILDDSFVEHGKPNPEIYIKCAAALHYPPADCVVFEDSLSGVAAGKAAGCKVVGVATTHTHAELADTDLVIDDFMNLNPAEIIQKLYK